MKKRNFVFVLFVVAFIICFVCFFIMNKNKQPKPNDKNISKSNELSLLKKKVSLDDINKDETVLILEVYNGFTGQRSSEMAFNKNKHYKFVSYNELEGATDACVLRICDETLRDKRIPYGREQLDVSDDVLSQLINVNKYNVVKGHTDAIDSGTLMFYSVCGSGKNRTKNLIKIEYDERIPTGCEMVDKVCDSMKKSYHDYCQNIIQKNEKLKKNRERKHSK